MDIPMGRKFLASSDPLSTSSFPGWDDPTYTSMGFVTDTTGSALSASGLSSVSVVGQPLGQVFATNDSHTVRSGFLGLVLPLTSNPRSRDTDADGMPISGNQSMDLIYLSMIRHWMMRMVWIMETNF